MKPLLAGLLFCAALAAHAASPFFVFDNGLRGENLYYLPFLNGMGEWIRIGSTATSVSGALPRSLSLPE